MKNTSSLLPPEQTVSDLAHLAWCALIALRFAQQDSQALAALTAHTFLIRWLAVAQKQRRFPRSVATDIDNLLKLGRQKGVSAGLHQRLEYLWQSCSNPVAQQSDLFRLTHAIEHLRSQGWANAVATDNEWHPAALCAEYSGVPALLVRKSELQGHFTYLGQQFAPVDFIVVGNRRVVEDAFDSRELRYAIRVQYAGWCLLSLLPSADAKTPEKHVASR